MIKPISKIAEAKIPIALLDDLRKGEVYAFIGSGISIPLGYPSWDQLVSRINSKISENLWSKDYKTESWIKKNLALRPDWVAELLKFTPGDLYNKSLIEIFKENEGLKFSLPHALLSIIPFKGILTTNYDTLIEDYIKLFHLKNPSVWNHVEILDNPSFRKNDKFNIYKIHGCIEKDVNSLVLATSDYYKLINDKRFTRFLDGIFSQNTIITFGFSLLDRNFRIFVEERFNLYKSNCSPMYCIIGENETCTLEMELYANKYNIQIIPISEKNSFEELTSLLLSLFCLSQKVDSRIVGKEINQILEYRLSLTKFFNLNKKITQKNLKRAERFMSIFKEPIDIDLFATICTDAGMDLSPAHFRALFKTKGNLLFTNNKLKPKKEDIEFISQWVSSYLETIPLGKSSRYLSIHYKKFLINFSKTIYYLLSTEIGWQNLIGDKKDSHLKLRRINEFHRQEGKWNEWIDLCDKIERFIDLDSKEYLELLKTKVWVFFWTRRFNEAKTLIEKYPQIDEKKGQYSFWARIKYMQHENIIQLVDELEKEEKLEYFNLSLLGRSYARLAIKNNDPQEKERLLILAKDNLEMALSGAKRENDMIEVAVQSWYLALTYSDLGMKDESYSHFSEVKRLDESIMNRIPGKAWLRLAEYRIYKNDENIDPNKMDYLRKKAYEKMSSLGIIELEKYIEEEYYY